MNLIFAQTSDAGTADAGTTTVTTTTGIVQQWVDTPMAVALIFGLAGAFFIGIYFLRRLKRK